MVLWRTMRILFLAFIVMGVVTAYPLWRQYRGPVLALAGLGTTRPAPVPPTAQVPVSTLKSPTPAFPPLVVPAQPENPFTPKPTPVATQAALDRLTSPFTNYRHTSHYLL